MISQESLKSLLTYYPETGGFLWNISGKIAGTQESSGYLAIQVCGKKYKAHRLAFLYMKGYMPKVVDHVDRNRINNRWDNLRECTSSQNQINSAKRISKSGVTGVTWVEHMSKWRLRPVVGGRRVTIGFYSTIGEARVASANARKTHYGDFAKNVLS